MNLKDSICSEIKQKGDISFAEFMHLALYHKDLGYYCKPQEKFGKQGDFVTAPELTPLFGYTLANQCQEIFRTLTNPCLFEFGAGSGRLCVDILTRLQALSCLPDKYYILEVSPSLKAQQSSYIKACLPHLYARVEWVNQWPSVPFSGVIIANEVLDAMPIHRFQKTSQTILESYITVQDDEFIEVFKPCHNRRLIEQINEVLPTTDEPYTSEVNLFLEGWLLECFAMLEAGVLFIIDYGFPSREYYHPQRVMGTLMCHHRHMAHANPLIHVGEQDITSHVDFSTTAHFAYKAGFDILGFANQASFLLANGLLSLLQEMKETQRLQESQMVKQLLQEHEMGELFKVLALGRHMSSELTGFMLQNKRNHL